LYLVQRSFQKNKKFKSKHATKGALRDAAKGEQGEALENKVLIAV
jgi:hypothetical protein